MVPMGRLKLTLVGFRSRYVVKLQQSGRFGWYSFADDIVETCTIADHERGDAGFLPKFDDRGLVSAIVIDATSGEVLMVAFMDAKALSLTRTTGLAHFHSRSRGRLWLKGETSGHFLHVEEIRVDCDQDALLLRVRPDGPACHTGARSCFYRKLTEHGLEQSD